jgi:ABC-type multidrug transport system fused ATPase/permease subunit
MNNHKETFKNIDKMYDKLTYFDKYGGSLIFFILISILLFLGISCCFVIMNIQPIKDNWVNERCKPYIIPFAGIINRPENMSNYEYTNQNFQYCMQNIIKDVTGEAVQPLTFITNILNEMANIIKASINAIRNMFNKVRTEIQSVTQEVMGRLGNIMVPLQQIIIAMRDMLSKVQGVMTAALYTMLGSYYTLQSLMGAIAQFIILILIALAAIIIVLWLLPFTWGVAATMTALFLSIAIPMAIILNFMMESLKVRPSMSIPTIQCFDEETMIGLEDGTFKKIKDIHIGDNLLSFNQSNNRSNNHIKNTVTAIFKVDANLSKMYSLEGILVSDSHLVKYNEKWIRVSSHPSAKKVAFYDKPFLYCLNTNEKTILIGNTLFSDWDEEIVFINDIKENDKNVVIGVGGGFHEKTTIFLQDKNKKHISEINIGDILEKGEKVIGIVEMDGTLFKEHYSIDLGIHEKIQGAGNLHYLSILPHLVKKEKIGKREISKRFFHLLTNTQRFSVKNQNFYDYNASLDRVLEKIERKILSIKYV